MNLIVGATGNLGSEICRQLAAKGKPVRALVRATSDPAKVAALRDCGAEPVQGDLRDPASLAAACQGVTAVISTVSSMPFSYQPGENDIQSVDLEGVKVLIDAAQAAGVQHLVYTSFTGNIELDFPLRNAKRAVEQYLKDSGLVYTILRPSYFMEAWLGPAVGFDYPNAKARVYGAGQSPISWISLLDVVQFAVESVDNPGLELFQTRIDPSTPRAEFDPDLLGGVWVLRGETVEGRAFTAIPYAYWANRGESQMVVWVSL